jgi:tetratricopeptide (TPR) repeat protein
MLGSYERAVADYNRAIEINPSAGFYFTARADAHDMLGNKFQAELDRAEANRLNALAP